jgi:hypothetical protein
MITHTTSIVVGEAAHVTAQTKPTTAREVAVSAKMGRHDEREKKKYEPSTSIASVCRQVINTVYVTGKERARAHAESAHVRARGNEYEADVNKEPNRCGYTRND